MNDEELAKISEAPVVGDYNNWDMDWNPVCINDNYEWFNPFSIDDFGLEGAVEHYKAYIQKRPDLMAKIPELRGRYLACGCRHHDKTSPLCHGDALVDLYLEWAKARLAEDKNYFSKRTT